MKIALLIPCYNEAPTIAKVVCDFKKQLPGLEVYVYDNNSTDATAEEAAAAGAIVRREPRQGKGNVVRQMFRDVEADVYLMVDGDDTYPAAEVKKLLQPVLDGHADMVIGDRLSNGSYYKENSRSFHGLGNNLIRAIINRLWGVRLHDIITGYRVFTRPFVKSFLVRGSRFQLETELTTFALHYNFRLLEVPVTFSERPEGSVSKLDTYGDGMRYMVNIANLYRHYRSLAFFSIIGLLFALGSLAAGVPVLIEYARTAFVTRVPLAILAVGLMVLAMLMFVCGLVLDTLSHNDRARFEQILKK